MAEEDVLGFDGADEILRARRNSLRPDPGLIAEDHLLIEPSCNPVVGAAVQMPI